MEGCIREVVAADKTSVLQINQNVYEGLDYLPEYFDYFLKCEHTTQYVRSNWNKIIAYVSCDRVDNGETMISRAGRVSPEHQGKHVYKHLINKVETLQKDSGTLKWHAMTRNEPPSASFLRSYKPVAAKDINMFEYRRGHMAEKLSFFESKPIRKGRKLDNIPTDFLSEPYRNYLFPEGRVILDWVPFRPIPENIPLFKGYGTIFYSDISSRETIDHDDEGIANVVQGLLSASTIMKAFDKLGLSCYLDIFGTDVHSLCDHMLFHLQQIQTWGLENINLSVMTTKGIESSIDEIMENFDVRRLEKGKANEPKDEMVVYEKAIV